MSASVMHRLSADDTLLSEASMINAQAVMNNHKKLFISLVSHFSATEKNPAGFTSLRNCFDSLRKDKIEKEIE